MIARLSGRGPSAGRLTAHSCLSAFARGLLLACAALAAGCGRVPTPSAFQTQGFEIVSADPQRPLAGTLDYAYRIRERIDLSANPPSGMMVGAGLEVNTLWGEIKIGADGKRMIAMVRRAEEGLLWIRLDSDLDGDLQDETVEEWRPRARPLRFITRDILLDEPGENGVKPRRLRLAFAFDADHFMTENDPHIRVEAFVHWQGAAHLEGERLLCAVFPPNLEIETSSEQSRLVVDFNQDGQLDGMTDSFEHMNARDIIPFGGRAWRIKYFAPEIGWVEFEPLDTEPPARALLGIGDPAVWFQGLTAGGEPFNLESLEGRIILLQFWSRLSPGAEEDERYLERLNTLYETRGLSIVRLNMDRLDPAAKQNAALEDAPWVELAGPGGRDDPIARLYRAYDLPWTILIGRDGLIVAKNLGKAALQGQIDSMADPEQDIDLDLLRFWR